MKEIFSGNDHIRMSLSRQVLAEEGIDTLVLDENTGSLFGGIDGIRPRLMVLDEDEYDRALALLRASGLVPPQ